jgi:hypothetical protein
MLESGANREHVEDSIAQTTVVLAPTHLVGVRPEIRSSNVMMNADLGTAQAAKEALGLICASVAVAVRL